MSAKYKSPSFLLPNELNTSANPANDTGVNSLYSMDFDSSSSDYINTDLSININSFSVSCWFKGDNLHTGGQKRLFDFADSTRTANKFPVLFTGSSAYGSIGVGKIAVFDFTTSQSISATWDTNRNGLWNHVVLLVNNTNVELYLNGSSLVSGTITRDTYQDMTKFVIGTSSNYSSTQHFNGQIDEVAIFNRALDSTEISALYDGSGSNIRPSNLMATNLNPIAYYPLGEQAQMQGYLGNEASSEWQFPNGVLQDYVMDFDGSTDYIDVGSSAGVIGTEVRTFSVWLKTSTTSTQTILGTRNYNTDGWVIQIDSNNIMFYNVKTPNNRIQSSTNLTDGNWYHLVIVRGKTTSTNKIYVNGSSKTLTYNNENGTDPQSSKNLLIGVGYNTGGALYRFFDGEMSNLAIWNTDQSANIANIYNNGSPQTTYTVTPQNWWKLNADSVYTPSAPNYTTALYFDGTDEIQIPSFSLSSEFSIGVWLNADTFAAGSSLIFGYNANNSEKIEFNGSSSILIKNATANITYSGTSWNLNEWQHLLITRDSSNNLKIYRNGEYWGGNSHSGTFIFDRISGFNNSARHFNGRLSNIAIFNSELSSTQVSTLFNFGTPETNISFSPTAWWKLDNTTTGIQDSSGNGHTGTNNGAAQVSSSVAVVPSWKITSALTVPEHNYLNVLNFNNDEVTLSSLSNFVTNNFTASIWVNYETLPASYRGNPMGATNGGGWETGFGFVNNGITGKLMFIVQNWDNNPAGSGGIVNSTTTFTTNKWFHLAGTWDGSTVTFYINGVSQGTATYTGSLDTSDVLSIGTNLSGSGYDIDAILSNAVIFNTALPATGTESVASLYNNGTPPDISSYSSLTGWWKLDSTTITDYSGNGNTGTNNGAEVEVSNLIAGNIPVNGVSTTLPSTALQQSDLQFDSPYSNYSLSFDGTGGYIDCGDSDIFSFGNSTNDSPFSISAWIYMDSTTNFRILAKYDAPNYEYQFDVGGSSNLRFFIFDGTSYRARIGSTLSINQWYHVVATYNGVGNTNAENGIKIYVDGVEITGTTDSNGSYTAMHNTTAPVYIGRIASSYANGKIDETSIFNYSLSEAQVLEIYNNGRPNDLSTFSGTAPISWWRLGENAYFDNNSTLLYLTQYLEHLMELELELLLQ